MRCMRQRRRETQRIMGSTGFGLLGFATSIYKNRASPLKVYVSTGGEPLRLDRSTQPTGLGNL